MYWTHSFPEDALREMIDNSVALGLYKVSSDSTSIVFTSNAAASGSSSRAAAPGTVREQIGFARLITDNMTFAYLTDLYVLPDYQGLGLGGWLIDCVGEVLRSMYELPWAMLRTSGEKCVETYKKRLGMSVLAADGSSVTMGKRGAGYDLKIRY